MNTLHGQISNIETTQHLALVHVAIKDIVFSAVVIKNNLADDYLKVGNPIKLLFKETEVVVATKNAINISLQNKIPGIIQQLEKGKLLSKLTINTNIGNIISVITSNAVEQLKLEQNSEVIAMIKTNEIMLSQ